MQIEQYQYRRSAGLRTGRFLSRCLGQCHRLRLDGLQRAAWLRVHSGEDRYISASIARDGIWEAQETALLLRFLSAGDVFLDVGANIGYFSVVAAMRLGASGRVLAFEPEPANFFLLCRNLALNGCRNARAIRAALADQDGTAELYLSASNMGDHTVYPSGEQRRHCTVPMVRGSECLADVVQRVDFIKVDTQGFETQVLRGLRELIAASLPRLRLLLEFSPFSLRQAGSSGGELLQLLIELDLSLYIMESRSGRLIPCAAEQLAAWLNLTEREQESESFINLFCSGAALEAGHDMLYRDPDGLEADPIEELFAARRAPWSGQLLRADELHRTLYLARGWCEREQWGVWSEGAESRLRFTPEVPRRDQGQALLVITGRYFADNSSTQLSLNGEALGTFRLDAARVPLPRRLVDGRRLELCLCHQHPTAPAALGLSSDTRALSFGLESIALEWKQPG